MNFSLRTLLLITAGAAVVLASLAYVRPWVGDLFYTFGLLTVAFALLAAIYHRGATRAYWIGFIVVFVVYFCHTVWPPELRSIWMAASNDFSFRTHGMISSRVLNLLFYWMHGPPMISPLFGGTPTAANRLAESSYIAFMTVGHTTIALLLAIAGGALARHFVDRSDAPAPNS